MFHQPILTGAGRARTAAPPDATLMGEPLAPGVGTCDSGAVGIRFVGSGDAFGTGGRFQTCIRLHGDGYTVLVDCGATSLTAMKAQHVDPGEVDAVVVSHLHGDHFGGLPFLVLDGQFTRRTRPLTVLGPTGTAERLRAAMETLYPGSTPVQRRYALQFGDLDGDGGRFEIGPLTVLSWQVDHASGAPALAVQAHLGGATFGYSGDTAWILHTIERSVSATTATAAVQAECAGRRSRR